VVFVFILPSRFRSVKGWLVVFDLFLAVCLAVAIVSLDQFFGFNTFIESSNGARLAATIGNAGYVGGYMVFGVFISLFLFFKRHNNWVRGYYATVFLIELFITVQTQTRGAYLALAFGLGVSTFYLCWFYFKDKRLKVAFLAVAILIAMAVSGIFVFKNSNFIKSNTILNRIASISLTNGTANNRMVTWKIGWQGFKERPIFGYGQENFYQPFDKYYTTKNSEQWFDRCHNMICDRAITGGLIGLIGYLALLLVPFWALWRYYKKDYVEKTEIKEHLARRYFTPTIFTILIIAYIIQNLFIFEALVTYIPLIIILSFVGLFGKNFDFKFLDKKIFKTGSLIFVGIAFLPTIYFFNLKPIGANIDFIKALSSQASLEQKIAGFEDTISRNTLGNQEYRRHFANVFEGAVSEFFSSAEARNNQQQVNLLAGFADKIESQLNDQISENPHSVANYLTLMRFYNLSYIFKPERLEKAIVAFEKAKELSPGRPQVYYEGATTYYYLANYSTYLKKDDKAAKNYRQALAVFYDGTSKNINQMDSFDQLLGFLMNLSAVTNKDQIAKSLVSDKIGDKSVNEIIDQLEKWLSGNELSQDQLANKQGSLSAIKDWLFQESNQKKQ